MDIEHHARSPRAGLSAWLLGKLSRVTHSTKFIPEIDGLRFLAIFSVILLHICTVSREGLGGGKFEDAHHTDWFANILHRGGVGVMVFFGISGFVLALPFALHHLTGSRAPRLRDYFLRRVTRLEPPYLLSLLGMYFALRLVGAKLGVPPEKIPDAENLAASFFYVHNLVFGEYSRVNGVAWSLEVEVQFYILAPFIALIFTLPKTARRVIIVSVALAAALVKGGFDAQLERYRLDLSLIGFLHCFLVGFLFADVYIADWRQKPVSGSWTWDVLGLLGIAGILPVGDSNGTLLGVPEAVWYHPLFLVANFLIFVAAFRGRLLHLFFTRPWIATIGGMCYTIYLIHQPMVHVLAKFTRNLVVSDSFAPNAIVQGIVLIPPVLAACAVYFMLIERPCMYKDWPRRVWNWARRAPARDHPR
jgi:peptidoglycan/LPS O-acetylase OafA/YrhL